MKLSTSSIIAALCWSARLASAATAAHVYTFDPESSPHDHTTTTLSPVQARLVLAHRAAVEDYHVGDLLEPGAIEAINALGRKGSLFADTDSRRHLLMLVHGLSDQQLDLDHANSFSISPAPSNNATQTLVVDLARQNTPSAFSSLSDAEALALIEADTLSWDLGDGFISLFPGSKQQFEKLWDDLVALRRKQAEQNMHFSITAILTSKHSATGASSSLWGTYNMPQPQTSLLHKRQRQQEEPLELENDTAPFAQPLQATPTSTSSANNTQPLKGIYPTCFPSRSTCESLTRNCTGRGACTLKYTDKDVNDGTKQCYSCACKPSTKEDSEGRISTTYWGGPACQKKDVSVQFWMIALFSVGMVFLVSFAVGSVWSMGDETLPSVIGAGVSGPGARR